ncbi:MAG: hypothetical protein U0Y10_02125 [Spirosomataceae bacterium]
MSGIYSVTVGGSGNCTGTATTSVVINASPVATASSNSPVCSGSNTLNLNASGGSSYSWAGSHQVLVVRFKAQAEPTPPRP